MWHMTRLKDKVTVITGASSGIGRAIALAYAREGARVIVNYNRSKDRAEDVVSEIQGFSGQAVAIQADIAEPDAVARLLNTSISEFGRIDVWVNNAGADILTGSGAQLTDGQKLERLVDVDLKGTIQCCWSVAEIMQRQGGGVILNVSSGAIDLAYEGIGIYAFTKAAVAMLGRTLSLEVGQYGIRVCTLAPGSTLTNFTTWRLHNEDGTLNQEAYDEFLDYARDLSPIGALGEALDQAYLMLYLASDAGKFTTGNVFRSNGGQTTTF